MSKVSHSQTTIAVTKYEDQSFVDSQDLAKLLKETDLPLRKKAYKLMEKVQPYGFDVLGRMPN